MNTDNTTPNDSQGAAQTATPQTAVTAPESTQPLSATPKKSNSKTKANKKIVGEAAPEKYAIVKFGGHQVQCIPGSKIVIEKVEGDVGGEVLFSDVLFLKDGATISVGTPTVAGAKIAGKIVAHTRGEKLIIFKKRRRKGYTKKQGHRQSLTEILVGQF
jgi:large subunit ribosomal protein L21